MSSTTKAAKKSASKFGRLLGLGAERLMKEPQLVAVADGLVVTDVAAEAWYTLYSANTDLMPEDRQDIEQDAAALALAKVLPGYDCHLKIIWARLDGEIYREEAHQIFSAGDIEMVADMWARRLDTLDLPQRHILLGIRIAERDSAANATVKNGVASALGVGHTGLDDTELAHLDGLARRLERRLEATPWRARIAPAELLAWAISRESYRPQPAPPNLPTVSGAALVRLTQSKAIPHSDHVRMIDARGETAAWVSVLAMPVFPQELITPGEQEWLRCLSEITYSHPDTGEEALVCPEASVRFSVWRKGTAIKNVDKQRQSAKEQRKSAAEGSAGETFAETEETEAVMEDLRRQMSRDGMTLLEDHPRIVVSSTESLEDLRARCDAVVAHYAGLSIDVVVASEEQRELWLETQIGDMLRVLDLGHIRTTDALAASMFWGGSEAGDDEGPIAGLLTGTTPGVCRIDITAGSARGDATTTAFVGRSGRGKTTSMMLATLIAGLKGAFSLMLGFKGDEGGLVKAGEYLGLDSHHVTCGVDTPAVADVFRMLPKGDAALQVVSQLLIILPERMRDSVETHLLRAANAVAQHEDPATWRVIEMLQADSDPIAVEAGNALAELSRTQLGAPLLGKPRSGASPLRPEPGLWLVQVPGLTMPQAGTKPSDMTMTERVSLALMRGLIAYALNTSARADLRDLPKVVAIPEVHVLTGTDDGRRFIDYIARTGRALDTSLAIDTQDPKSLLGMDGVLEAITTVCAFEQSTRSQQDAMAELLRLPVSDSTRALIHGVGKDAHGNIRHGHCIIRDRRDRVATMQWDAPSYELLRALSTNPKDQAADHAEAEDAALYEEPVGAQDADSVHSPTAEGSEAA
ncbi:ATP-binding protein [Streptomyces sp. NPDC001795]|uniref:ATP-binding protein n=1 Tax=Streptomyces sp. NPDC001795 TaxID=3154525 RepID=UPI00331AE90A